jgi:kynurenine formamidase
VRNDRPAYRDLPALEENSDYRHAWGYYPADDNLGCLANLTPQARLRGLAAAREGSTVSLSLPLTEPDPPLFGREVFSHTIFSAGRNSMDDKLDSFYPQSSTQWDSFRHVRARQFGFFTGYTGSFDDDGRDRLGIDHWAEQGIVGRGILLDFGHLFSSEKAAGHADPGFGIDASALQATAAGEVQPGDILCIRTGWMANYLSAAAGERERIATLGIWPGLDAGPDVAELLWDWEVSAVVADNPAVEIAPGSSAVGSLHRRLLPLLGMPLGELFDFERLALELDRRERREFLFVSVPLKLPGGVGSPGNAVAML